MSIQAVIFDCDGVIVDSEVLSNRAMAEAMTAAGFPMTTEESMNQFMGKADDLLISEIDLLVGQGEAVIADYHHRLNLLIETELEAVPGAFSLLECLSTHKVPFAMASNSHRAKMQRTLGKTGADKWFEGRYFGRDDVQLGKPHPDLYLLASAFLNVMPEHCIVIEDSLTGAQAGLAAGCRVWGLVRDASPEHHLALGCERTYSSYGQLQSDFEKLIQV